MLIVMPLEYQSITCYRQLILDYCIKMGGGSNLNCYIKGYNFIKHHFKKMFYY